MGKAGASQSQHLPQYQAALDRLDTRGLLYPCFCTRTDITRAGGAPQGDHGPLYPGTCRHLSGALRAERIASGQAYALRLDVAKAIKQVGAELYWNEHAHGQQLARPELHGDVVLARTLRGVADAPALMPASYHLCVVYDDALQGVTLVTRGEDLLEATHIHRLLQALLELPVPEYHHHPLLRDEAGRRLAKRDKAKTLRELSADGTRPDELIGQLQLLLKA